MGNVANAGDRIRRLRTANRLNKTYRKEVEPEIKLRRPTSNRAKQRSTPNTVTVKIRSTGRLGVPLLDDFFELAADLLIIDTCGRGKTYHARAICVQMRKMLLVIRRQLMASQKAHATSRALWWQQRDEKICQEDEIQLKLERG
jgi:hypothetical protein